MATASRGQWSGRLGFVLAAAGSAVGLGNIWRFPYMAGENGGAAYLLVYLLFVIAIGLPLLLAELAIGRSAQREPASAFAALGGSPRWRAAGWPSVLAALVILAYYPVIAGWALKFFVEYLGGGPAVSSEASAEQHFVAFIASAEPVVWQAAIMLATLAIVRGGIGHGIEAANKVLMPILALLLIALALNGLSLPNAQAGVAFIFSPDWSVLATPKVYLAALGQTFFSLSLAMGALITYGSYVPVTRRLPIPAAAVAIGDSLFAVVAGLMIFPAVFSFGLDPASGPTLAFITMPRVFEQMPAGAVVGAAFFGLLVVAALSSSVSLLEVLVAFLMANFAMARHRATLLSSAVVFALGVPAALSFGWLGGFQVFGLGVLDLMDHFASNILLPLNGILIAAFVGWVWQSREARAASGLAPPLDRWWHTSMRYAAPLLIAVVLMHSLGLIPLA